MSYWSVWQNYCKIHFVEKIKKSKMVQDQENKQNSEVENQINEESKLNEEPQDDKSAEGTSEEVNVVDKLNAEVVELKDKYLRLYSEFDNFRRRTSKEKIDLIKTANEDVIASLIPVLDDFERAQKAMSGKNENDPALDGIALIYNKLFKTLEQKGLKPMDSIGGDFNSELHEAITQAPAPTPELKGKIIDVLEKGYYLNDKVVRFAKVIIGS